MLHFLKTRFVKFLSLFSLFLLCLLIPVRVLAFTDPVNVQITAPGNPIREVWEALLNFSNIAALIFFLAVAFANLLRIQINTYAVKKILPSLIVGIVLANFSFLICRLLMDVANALASLFLESTSFTNFWVESLKKSSGETAGAAMWLIAGILKIVAAVMIFILSIMFLLRNYVLMFLVVFSPLAFVAMAIPSGKGIWSRWWKVYTQWVFMLPVATFWLWIGGQFFNFTQKYNIGDNMFFTGIGFAGYAFGVVCIYMAMTTPFKMAGELSSLAGKLQNMAITATGVYAGTRAAQEWGRGVALNYTPYGNLVRLGNQMKAAREARIKEGLSGPVIRGLLFGRKVEIAGHVMPESFARSFSQAMPWLSRRLGMDETGRVRWDTQKFIQGVGNILTLGMANRGRRALEMSQIHQNILSNEQAIERASDVRFQQGTWLSRLWSGSKRQRQLFEVESGAMKAEAEADEVGRLMAFAERKEAARLGKIYSPEDQRQFTELRQTGGDAYYGHLKQLAHKRIMHTLGLKEGDWEGFKSSVLGGEASEFETNLKGFLEQKGVNYDPEKADEVFGDLDFDSQSVSNSGIRRVEQELERLMFELGREINRARAMATRTIQTTIETARANKISSDLVLEQAGIIEDRLVALTNLRKAYPNGINRDLLTPGSNEEGEIRPHLERINPDRDKAIEEFNEYLRDYERRPEYYDLLESRLRYTFYGPKISEKGLDDAKSRGPEARFKDYIKEGVSLLGTIYTEVQRELAHRGGKEIYGQFRKPAAERDYAEALEGIADFHDNLVKFVDPKTRALRIEYVGPDGKVREARYGETVSNAVKKRVGIGQNGQLVELNLRLSGINENSRQEIINAIGSYDESLDDGIILNMISKFARQASAGTAQERRQAKQVLDLFGVTELMNISQLIPNDNDDLKNRMYHDFSREQLKDAPEKERFSIVVQTGPGGQNQLESIRNRLKTRAFMGGNGEENFYLLE